MDEFKKRYEEAIHEKAEAFMKTLATSIAEQNAREDREAENAGNGAAQIQPSPAFDRNMRELIARMETRDKKRLRQKRMRDWGKIAAVLVLGLVITCGALTATVEAFRFRVFDFLNIEHDKYTELVPVESDPGAETGQAGFPADWTGVYYPKYLPEGYELAEASPLGGGKQLIFTKGADHYLDLTILPVEDTRTGVDNEDVQTSQIDIGGAVGYVWEKDGGCLIIWLSHELQFALFSGSLPLEEMAKVAQGIDYRKLQ